MLFISRYIWPDRYGVVDTDDGAEELVSSFDLQNAIKSFGVDINGVGVYTSSIVNGLVVLNIRPYQDSSTLTREQLKAQVMFGIRVTTWGSWITGIHFDERAKDTVKIRLSNFGAACGDCIFSGNPTSKNVKLILQLDDRVNLQQRTFGYMLGDEPLVCGTGHIGVVLDFHDILSDATAEFLYRALYGMYGDASFDIILDRNERKSALIESISFR